MFYNVIALFPDALFIELQTFRIFMLTIIGYIICYHTQWVFVLECLIALLQYSRDSRSVFNM